MNGSGMKMAKIQNEHSGDVEYEIADEADVQDEHAGNVEYEIADEADSARSGPSDRYHCFRPCMAEYSPLPLQPDWFQRFRYALLCPPHGRIGATLFLLIVGTVWWGVTWALTGAEALPGGSFFALIIVFFTCWCGGYLIELVRLPPLLGMLLVGILLGNAPVIKVAKDVEHEWSSGARQTALAIILIRAGLGLDPAALRRLSLVVIRLAFSPCLAETIVDAIAAHLILDFPWQWGFMLGFVIAAVSPAVVVPSLLSLSERGYGIDKGIPTLVMAASSIDDVIAITGFGVVLGITFSSGSLAWNLLKGPLEALLGVVYGVIGGVILWYIPQKNSKHKIFFRSAMLLGGSLFVIFGSKKVEWSGVGPLGCLTIAFVAALRWRTEYKRGEQHPIEEVSSVLWMVFQPLLFGLIGSEVKLDALDGDTVGLGIAVLACGLSVRILVSFLAVLGTNLNTKERLFVAIAWLPKATVQAAIGALAYDSAKEKGDKDLISKGEKILTLAVLSILLTAPTGAALVAISGPLFLHRTPAAGHLHQEIDMDVNNTPANAPQNDTVAQPPQNTKGGDEKDATEMTPLQVLDGDSAKEDFQLIIEHQNTNM